VSVQWARTCRSAAIPGLMCSAGADAIRLKEH
jgi:hypothetical protein